MVKSLKSRISLEPAQVLVMGFAVVIIIGTALLMLPFASATGSSASLLDAAFTSTSAVCVTGLVIRDTGTGWSYFGQIVILFLIQIGGLGFMTMATIILVLLGRRITLRDRLVIQEALNEMSLQGLVRLILKIVSVTVLFELIGVMLFSMRFIPAFGFGQGLYMSVFLSVSAFCNAGFDIVGSVVAPFSSFVPFRSDIVINFTTMLLVIIGGLGFTVLLEIGRVKKFKRMSLHTKLVLIITGILLVFGAVFFFIVELGNPATLGDPEMPLYVKAMSALFQSVTTRTAGFNTIDQNSLTMPSKMLSQIMMFIGASPGGTGGGMKTTTIALVFFMVLSVSQGHDNITVLKRRIPRGTAFRALAIVSIGLIMLLVLTMIISVIETGNTTAEFTFENILFEVVSALGTVGLSTGLTPHLSSLSRVVIIFTMFLGRLGPMTLTFALAKRLKKNNINYRYPEGKIMVG